MKWTIRPSRPSRPSSSRPIIDVATAHRRASIRRPRWRLPCQAGIACFPCNQIDLLGPVVYGADCRESNRGVGTASSLSRHPTRSGGHLCVCAYSSLNGCHFALYILPVPAGHLVELRVQLCHRARALAGWLAGWLNATGAVLRGPISQSALWWPHASCGRTQWQMSS